jgi:hypothetical protein
MNKIMPTAEEVEAQHAQEIDEVIAELRARGSELHLSQDVAHDAV